jgi:hypothetical protein
VSVLSRSVGRAVWLAADVARASEHAHKAKKDGVKANLNVEHPTTTLTIEQGSVGEGGSGNRTRATLHRTQLKTELHRVCVGSMRCVSRLRRARSSRTAGRTITRQHRCLARTSSRGMTLMSTGASTTRVVLRSVSPISTVFARFSPGVIQSAQSGCVILPGWSRSPLTSGICPHCRFPRSRRRSWGRGSASPAPGRGRRQTERLRRCPQHGPILARHIP